jgi:hypothetical protein
MQVYIYQSTLDLCLVHMITMLAAAGSGSKPHATHGPCCNLCISSLVGVRYILSSLIDLEFQLQ